MDNIIEPNESFDFTKITLAHPTGVQGGAYFTKIEYNKKPLYIQTCKSSTRQGFVKTGKKYYCDLMFDKNSESLINWFENLEEKCQKLIFEKRDTWFQNNLEEADIESAFNATIRVYKSGKYYLLRCNVKNNYSNVPTITIYDEHENSLKMDDLKLDSNIISILEIQGIKFTSRNFQIEIEIKQIMILDNEPIFDNLLIKTNKTSVAERNTENIEKNNLEIQKQLINNDTKENFTDTNNTLEELELFQQPNLESNDLDTDNLKSDDLESNDFKNDIQEAKFDLEIEDLNEYIEENNDELKEISVDLNQINNLETMQLKKPNQVYFELYKEARNKAKLAKKNAILAYLEAKNIKKTYMLDTINDSDSEFDAEIDEVSESELEGL
jgi:hypothetical protein